MSTKTYLVAGASRGIGQELTRQLLLRPSATVIAAVRSPSTAAKELERLPKAQGSRLVILPWDALDDNSAKRLVNSLPGHGVTQLDVLIGNGGVHDSSRTLDLRAERAARVLQITTISHLVLADEAKELLRKSPAPVFAVPTSAAGSLEGLDVLPVEIVSSPYGSSKAALNWYIRRLHFEEPWLTSVGVHPGLIDTGMTRNVETGSIKADDLFNAHGTPIEVGTKGYLEVVDRAAKDREASGGRMLNYDGTILPW